MQHWEQQECNVKEFISNSINDYIDFKKLKKSLKKDKFVPKVKGKVDINKEPMDLLISRIEDLCHFYMLYDKCIKGCYKKISEDFKQELDGKKIELERIVLENIVLLILRKFGNVVDLKDFNSIPSISQIEFLFTPIFTSQSIASDYFAKLPNDIRDTFFSCLENEGSEDDSFKTVNSDDQEDEINPNKKDVRCDFVMEAKKFNLLNLITKKGSEITIGTFNMNKKQEKLFLSKLTSLITNFIKENQMEADPEELLCFIVKLMATKRNQLIFFSNDLTFIEKFVEELQECKVSKFLSLCEESMELIEEFRDIEDSKIDVEALFERVMEEI